MSKKLLYTPNSRIRQALRQLWLRSRERAAALKASKYKCVKCGRKQSKAKGKELRLEVHHKHGILNWDELFAAVREYLLVDPSRLEPLCEECHAYASSNMPEEDQAETSARKPGDQDAKPDRKPCALWAYSWQRFTLSPDNVLRVVTTCCDTKDQRQEDETELYLTSTMIAYLRELLNQAEDQLKEGKQ